MTITRAVNEMLEDNRLTISRSYLDTGSYLPDTRRSIENNSSSGSQIEAERFTFTRYEYELRNKRMYGSEATTSKLTKLFDPETKTWTRIQGGSHNCGRKPDFRRRLKVWRNNHTRSY